MDKPQPPQPRTVAVVGTGMAGLATAHLLHQDPSKRYQVTLLEKVSAHSRRQLQEQHARDSGQGAHSGRLLTNSTARSNLLERGINLDSLAG